MSRISEEDQDVEFIQIRENAEHGIGGVWALEGTTYPQGIAIFLAMYTSLEFITASVLAKMLDIPEPRALALLDGINGYAPRLTKIERLAEERQPAQKEFYIRFVTEMRWLNEERNNYVHAHFAKGKETGKIYRALGATERRKQTTWEHFPVERLSADVMRARKLVGWVWENMRDYRAREADSPI